MLILNWNSRSPERRAHLVPIFGVGLLGSAVRTALRAAVPAQQDFRELSWIDPVEQSVQLAAIRVRLCELLQQGADGPSAKSAESDRCVQFVWSAGRAGFSATEAETRVELDSFRSVLKLAETVVAEFPTVPVCFALLSSVGGLFENCRYVQKSTSYAVHRPYGMLKRQQEIALENADPRIVKKVYRISSVIGPAGGRRRQGLIATLVENALRQRMTTLVGQMTTMRDFVWHEDVARYIAQALRCPQESARNSLEVLGSGRPATIHQVVKTVESVVGRRVYIRYSCQRTNAAHMTLAPTVLPKGWIPSDLRTCITRVYRSSFRG